MNESIRRRPAAMLIACIIVLGFWQIMAHWSARPYRAFAPQAGEFDGFHPVVPGWEIRRIPLAAGDIDPNILAFLLTPAAIPGGDYPAGPQNASAVCPSGAPDPNTPMFGYHIFVRLAHGYNMPDCMRIKGYAVELLGEEKAQRSMLNAQVSREAKEWISTSNIQRPTSNVQGPGLGQQPASSSPASALPPEADPPPAGSLQPSAFPGSCQVWRLTSALGERSIWVTSMLRADDFTATDADARSVPFPRVGIPDEADWDPHGLTWGSLRHPIRGFGRYLRARWNGARCDLATFLRLRQPAWASGELLTLVSTWQGGPVGEGQEVMVVGQVLAAHGAMQAALREWREVTTQVPARSGRAPEGIG
ncbi:MAG: hypothetical protein QME60_06390, partial [Verrucomicrobiota bacterium]|nr:hypothetical protein [Verrucomicrobiota bacterium]